MEDVLLVSAVSSSTMRGNRGKWRRPRGPKRLSLTALLRVAYERIRPGCYGVYTEPCRKPALCSMSKRAAATSCFFVRVEQLEELEEPLHMLRARVLRGLKMISQPLCNARDGCW